MSHIVLRTSVKLALLMHLETGQGGRGKRPLAAYSKLGR